MTNKLSCVLQKLSFKHVKKKSNEEYPMKFSEISAELIQLTS